MRRRIIACFSCMLWLFTVLPVDAGSLNVRPVRHYMNVDGSPHSLNIRNESEFESIIQVEMFSWNNSRNTEDLVPTSDLIIAPKIFRLPAGKEQLVRVKYVGSDAEPQERSYRMIVTEVPSGIGVSGGVALAVRLSMPVFVGENEHKPALEWRVDQGVGGVRLVAQNTGTGHVLIEDMALSGVRFSNKARDLMVSNYILPGQDHSWNLNSGSGLPDKIDIQATTLSRGEREIMSFTIPSDVKN